MTVRKSERKESRMEVQLKAVELVAYTLQKAANEKVVPKRDRWALGLRLFDTALDIAAFIDTANSMDINDDDEARERRLSQRKALAATYRLMTLVHTAASLRQIGDAYQHWTTLVMDTQRLLRGWMDSDRRRVRDARK